MIILVTGASGFIGRNMFSSVEKDIFLRKLYRSSVKDKFESDEVLFIESIDGSTNWDGYLHQVDVVIHLAGVAHNKNNNENELFEINTRGTIRLAEEAARQGVKRFVFVSTIGVNGSTTGALPFSADSKENPQNSYARSKYEAELALKRLERKTDLEVVIIRSPLIYGRNAPGNFGLLVKLIDKLPILPFGITNNHKSFIFVNNLVDLLITCATHPGASGQTFLASDGESVSTYQFTNAIATGMGKKIVHLPIPPRFMRLVGKVLGKSLIVEQLCGDLEVDSSKLKEVLDWIPPFTMKQAMATLRDSGVE